MPRSLTSHQLRELYQQFFESKGHRRIPSAPLVPENDPSALFTTAGMHPLVPYLKGQPHPAGQRLTNVQICLRTNDIDEVGDPTHATVFEMLGNWSLGDYFKKEIIAYSWEFLTSSQWLGLDPAYLAVTVFAGDEVTPRDDEAAQAWRGLGLPEERIAYLGKEDNWWPAGGRQPGPQGPDTEIFYWTGKEQPPKKFDSSDKRWAEIGNDVLMQYERMPDGSYKPLQQRNVDTGMGLERMMMAIHGLSSLYELDTFQPLMRVINTHKTGSDIRHERIIADHIKAATFLLTDAQPVIPSMTDQGYILRRLIRRAIRSARLIGVTDITSLFSQGVQVIINEYNQAYPLMKRWQKQAHLVLQEEVERFERVLQKGLRQFEQMFAGQDDQTEISGKESFDLYQTYGFPIEFTEELATEKGKKVDRKGFDELYVSHQRTSTIAARGKFKGGLVDHSTASINYHTATHLLHQALRQVLGTHVLQRGSNITPERLRFDFSHPKKMTAEEIQQVEDAVNEKIKANLPVTRAEMSVDEAKTQGALGLFEHKYGDKVSVYTIGDFSREICGGPHVTSTGTLGTFRITKEEAVSTGIRRIKAVLE